MTITITQLEIIAWRDNQAEMASVAEIEPTCAKCGGTNLVEREDADASVGYSSLELYCLDCQGSGS